MRILVSNPDSIGDFVLRQPMLAAMVEAGHELILIVRQRVSPFARRIIPEAQILELVMDPYSPTFDAAHAQVQDLFHKARETKPDRIVIAPYQWTPLEEALVKELAAAPVTRMSGVQFPPTKRRFDSSNHTIVRAPIEALETTKNEILASSILGARVHLGAPRIEPAAAEIREARELLEKLGVNHGRFLVASVASVSHEPRNWTTENWAEVLDWAAEHFLSDLILTGTADEFESSERVRTLMRSSSRRTLNFCDRNCSPELLVGLLALSRGYVGRDTGTVHLAAALGKPVIAVFGGGTWPRFVPNAVTGVVITAKVPCAGCGWLCAFSEPHCLRLVSAQAVIEAAKNVNLDRPNGLRIHELNPSQLAKPEVLHQLNTKGVSQGAHSAWNALVNLAQETEGITEDLRDPVSTLELHHDVQAGLAEFIVTVQSHLDSMQMVATTTVQRLSSYLGEFGRFEDAAQASRIITDLEQKLRDGNAELSRREANECRLDHLLVAKYAAYQSQVAHTGLERFQARLQVVELQKQVALRDTELAKLHAVVRDFLADQARTETRQRELELRHEAELHELRRELLQLQTQCATLRDAMEGSIALRFVRSLNWLLGPVRKLIG